MGTLNLPTSSLVYLDTSPVIYSVEKFPEYVSLLAPLWLKLQAGEIEIVSSELILMETPEYPRLITHVVELVNEGYEDEPQWEEGTWGIFRWVKIQWIVDFTKPENIPRDEDVMQAKWVWRDTTAKKLLKSDSLMSKWGSIDNLRAHLKEVFI